MRRLNAATQMMVAIARALQGQEKAHEGILVLDEPTASLPRHEVEVLFEALQRYAGLGQTILYVTHRLEEVTRVATHATVLRNGRKVQSLERSELSHDALVSAIMGETAAAVLDSSAHDQPSTDGPVVLSVRGASVGGTDLLLRAHEIVGVAGLLGSGRSRLLRGLFGLEAESREALIDGERAAFSSPRAAMHAGVAYLPEDRHRDSAFNDLSVAENLSITTLGTYSRLGRLDGRAERARARSLIRAFSVTAASERMPLSSLSGGNQQKVVLARWMQRRPDVFLLDEPTQGVDVGARAEIHRLIRGAADEGAAALVVCSEFEELIALCGRALVVRAGEVVADLSGDELSEDTLNKLVYTKEGNAR